MTCPHCGHLSADYAVQLAEACRRLGISQRYGETLIQQGRFPVPELPRLPGKTSRHRFSAQTIADYLRSDVADVVPNQRQAS